MVRKVTKTKGVFSSEDTIVKQIYLATINAKWLGQMFGWPAVRQDLDTFLRTVLIANDTQLSRPGKGFGNSNVGPILK